MKGPLISVVMATRNRQKLLTEAVKSIQDQTFPNFEIIIVDDASADGTSAVISEMISHDPRIRSVRSEKNVGPGAARNLGFDLAKGKYIAIMDDDDLADAHRLESQLQGFNENPEAKLVFSSVAWVDDDLNPTNIFPGIVAKGLFPTDPGDVFRLLYLESNKIPNATIMFLRELAVEYRYIDYPWIGEDWYFCMQLAASGIKMSAISTSLLLVRRGKNRQGLMADSTKVAFQAQRKGLEMMRKWLAEECIDEFDDLHKPALSNQIIRESRHFIGIKGLSMLLQAFLIWPGNPKVKEQLRWYFDKLRDKQSGRKGAV